MGIDPGIGGGIALYDYEKKRLVNVYDFPTEKDRKGRNRIDVLRTAFLLDSVASLVKVCLIEEVGFQTGKESAHSQFVFGFATGEVHGILAACQIPTATVKPAIWKMEMGLTSSKTESIERAKELFPEDAPKYLTLKKHHGRAEAILLAWYAAKKMGAI